MRFAPAEWGHTVIPAPRSRGAVKRAVVVLPLLPVIATTGTPGMRTSLSRMRGSTFRAIMPVIAVPPPRPMSLVARAALLPAARARIPRGDREVSAPAGRRLIWLVIAPGV